MQILGSIRRQLSLLRHRLRRFLSREPKTGPPGLDLRFLEDRILYSAAPLACELLASQGMAMDAPNHLASNADSCVFAHFEDGNSSSPASTTNIPLDVTTTTQENTCGFDSLFAQLAPLDRLLDQNRDGEQNTPTHVSHELIVIDSSLEDDEALLSSWLFDRDYHRQFSVLQVDRDVNGIDLVGEYLVASEVKFDAIHFVTHGIAGYLELGDAALSTESLEKHAASLAMWRSGMTDQTELLLYGCSIASNTSGLSFIDELASLLQIDIAASTNWTGPESLGGDWVLEYSHGQIETPTLFGYASEYWRFVLAANNAPILNNLVDPTLGTVLEGATNPSGVSVASMLVDGSITDPDGSPVEAVAITGINTTLDTWQYSLNGGSHWLTIDANGINSQANELALLLGPTAQLRMIPFGDLNGTLSDAITFRAWDQTGGTQGQYIVITSTGGTTAFSDASDTASLIVAGMNDAPTFFAGDGIVTTGFGTGNSICYGMAVQPDGKVLLTGYSVVGGSEDFALVRYNLDGSLDSSFGNGTGKVTTSIGSGVEWSYSVLVQSDGKIVLGGTVGGSNDDFALLRFNTDGSLDTSFGTNGKVSTSIGGSTDQGYGLAVQADGKLVIGGYASIGGTQDFALARYNIDGSLDTSFGNGGKITTAVGSSDDQAFSITIQSDGRILSGGVARVSGNEDFALVRYNNDGTLDSSFGTGGRVTTGFGSGNDRGWSMIVQADGKIVVGGSTTINNKLDFAVARYLADGTPDSSFGAGGRVITSICSDNDAGRSVTLQADGKILVAGYARDNGFNEFAIARYNVDGSLDNNFGIGGMVITSVGAGNDYGLNVRVQTDGKILMSGFASAGVPNNFALVRYNADGSLDRIFDPLDTLGGTVTYRLQGAPVVLDTNVRVFDAELTAGSFNGSTLTLIRSGGGNAQDLFSATGTLGTLTQGGNVTLDGLSIGTVTTNSGGTLTLTFNANANNSFVNSAMQQIAFANPNGIPFTQVPILWTFSDQNNNSQGSGGPLTTTGTVTVNIAEPNQAPIAVSDSTIAVEAGGVSNGTAGINPSGNVLSNDIDLDNGDTKTVTGIVAGNSPSAVGNVASPVAGAYGSITIAANGAFNYTVDNSNVAVQSLRTSVNTVTDVFTYTMRDAEGSTSSTQITVTIQGANDAPHDLAGPLSVVENATNGTLVGTVTRSDFDSGDGAMYSLVDSAGGRFAINSSTGTVTVANGLLLDRETATSHSITIRVADSAGAIYHEDFLVTVIDVDEFDVGPILDTNAAANSVAENAADGTAVGITASAFDADATNSTVTYSLDDSAGGRFSIDSVSGVVTVADRSLLNFEAMTSHGITVRATSSDGSFSTENFTVGLIDVDEFDVGPILDTDGAANSVAENAADGTAVGITASAFDADATNSTVTYSLDDSAGGRFSIDSVSGVVTVADRSLLNFEAITSHVITVRATSSGGSFSDANFTISVLPANEQPIAFGEQYQTDFASPITISLSQLLLNDVDPDGDSLHLVLLATPTVGEWMIIDGEEYYYQPEPNYIGQIYIFYAVSDGALVSDPQIVEIAVTSPSSIVVAPPQDKEPRVPSSIPGLIVLEQEVVAETQQSSLETPKGQFATQQAEPPIPTSPMEDRPVVEQSPKVLPPNVQVPLISVIDEFVRERKSLVVYPGDDYSTTERLFIDTDNYRIPEPKQLFLDRFGAQVERVSELTSEQGFLHRSVPTVGLSTAISAGVSLHVLISAQMGSAILSQAGLSLHMEAIMLESHSKSKAVKGAASLYEYLRNSELK